jgi:DNA-binding response OmpR family regulator
VAIGGEERGPGIAEAALRGRQAQQCQLVGSAQLLTSVLGPGFQQRTNYLRFHMARLCRRLEDNPHCRRHLLTEPGMGYRYQPEPCRTPLTCS